MGFTDHRPSPLSGLAISAYGTEHRRRASMPLTPPPSSRGQYFADRPSPSALHRRPPSISSAHAYHTHAAPLSPPLTPVRSTPASSASASASARPAAPPAYAYTSEKLELPTHNGSSKGKGRGLHHRRISTATVIRALAAQGRLPVASAGGVVVTPSKVASWLVIIACTAYLGSLLHVPSPVDLFTSHHARAPIPSTPVRPLADQASRHSWARELPYRAPGQQAVVPAHRQARLGPDGWDSSVVLDHPETFAGSREQPARRLRKKPARKAGGERDAKIFAAVQAQAAAAREAAGAGPGEATAAAVEVKERESFAVHPDLVAESPNRKFAHPATGDRGRPGAVNRLHRAKKPISAAAAAAVVDSSIAAGVPEAVQVEEAKAAVPAAAAKRKSRKQRKQEKELARHAAHALARAAERRKEQAQQAAAAVDWSLEGDADEGDE